MWSFYRAKQSLLYENCDGKRVNQKYTLATFDEDFQKLESKVGVECPIERKADIKSQLLDIPKDIPAIIKDIPARTLYSLPSGTILPAYIQKCSDAEEVSLILRLGVDTKQKVDEIARDCVLESLISEKEAENSIAIAQVKREISAKYGQELSRYQQELEDSRQQLRTQQEILLAKTSTEKEEILYKLKLQEQENTKSKQIIDDLRTLHRNTFSEEFRTQFDLIQKSLESKYEAQLSELRKDKESQIGELRREKTDLNTQLNGILRIRDNSSKLGKDGELNAENMIQKVFSDSKLETIESGCGDFVQTYKGLKIMWEIKNHHTSVPKKDVDKFHRDMRNNMDMDIGIILALNSHIEAHNSNGGFEFEFLNDSAHRGVFYISNLASHENPEGIFRMLGAFVSYIQRTKPTLSDSSQMTNISMKLNRILNNVALRSKVWKKRRVEMARELEENSLFLENLSNGLGDILEII